MSFIMWLIIGALAGFLAGKMMKGGGFGLLKNIILGIIGAYIGGFLFKLVGITTTGMIGTLITATIGAVVLLWVAGKFRKA